MSTNPLKHYSIPSNMLQDPDTIKMITAKVVDMTDAAIVQAVKETAVEMGVTDLYLLDREFIMAAINNELERRKNDPLTIEELQRMHGEPVYVFDKTPFTDHQWCIVFANKHSPEEGAAVPGGDESYSFDFSDYGKTWIAYRRKPEDTLAKPPEKLKSTRKPYTPPMAEILPRPDTEEFT